MYHQIIRGLVIRETDFGDANRYITVLTQSGMKIEILCKNIRKKNNRLASAVRVFCFSEIVVYKKGDKYTLNDASLIHSFWNITQNIETYSLSCYFCELLIYIMQENTKDEHITLLALHSLKALSEQKVNIKLIKAAFELKIMSFLGFCPDLCVCGACLKKIENQVYFSFKEGVSIDEKCKKRIGSCDFVGLSMGTKNAFEHILSCEIKKLFLFSLGEKSLSQLSILCEQYILYHLARGFSSLEFYHTICK